MVWLVCDLSVATFAECLVHVAACVALIGSRYRHCKRVHRLLDLVRVIAECVPIFAGSSEGILRTIYLILELLLHVDIFRVLLLPCVVLAVANHHYKHCTEK